MAEENAVSKTKRKVFKPDERARILAAARVNSAAAAKKYGVSEGTIYRWRSEARASRVARVREWRKEGVMAPVANGARKSKAKAALPKFNDPALIILGLVWQHAIEPEKALAILEGLRR